MAVAGNHEIGVSNGSALCGALAATPVTECDRSTADPSKGSEK
jgi:hypothetical protein